MRTLTLAALLILSACASAPVTDRAGEKELREEIEQLREANQDRFIEAISSLEAFDIRPADVEPEGSHFRPLVGLLAANQRAQRSYDERSRRIYEIERMVDSGRLREARAIRAELVD